MTKYTPGSRYDYRVGDHRYDPRVVDVGGSRLRSDQADWAAFMFDDAALGRQAAADRAALEAVVVAREEQVHRLVVWTRLEGRRVCTCGLVLQMPERLHARTGHRDHRWEHLTVYVAQDDDGAPYLASCGSCGVAAETTDLTEARAWCAHHDCPSAPPNDTQASAADVKTSPTEKGAQAVAAPTKIVDEREVIRWIEEGRTYRWIQEEYRRKYGIETGLAMWSNVRLRRGLEPRIARDDQLIPWEVALQHRSNYNLAMLRVEARRRAGLDLRETDQRRLDSWLRHVAEVNAVVLYDPQTPDGFSLVPRETGDDDLIRQPTDARLRTKRHRAD
ncbi:hypothetical protein [Xylanimonas protaetiae]|uniref:hypothetical protein n=1 Tax=Xylanimonas protaetiae TaxID=2509457 RepID=UPI001A92C283|nr:hypothetical protein [Xylanimonas protaetiae]